MTKKILIALPCYRTMEAESVNSLCQVLTWSNVNLFGYQVELKMAARQQVVVARCGLAQYALDHGFDYVLFIDDDQIWPNDVLSRFLNYDVDVVSGLYYRRTIPFSPVAFFGTKISSGDVHYVRMPMGMNGLVSVDAIGMGCVLIKRSVLESLEQPFFVAEDEKGSDIHFCEKIKEAGFDILVDCDCVVGHLGDRPVIDNNMVSLSHANNSLQNCFQSDVSVQFPSHLFKLNTKMSDQDREKILLLEIKVDPTSYKAYRELAILMQREGHLQKACDYFRLCSNYAEKRDDWSYVLSSFYYLGETHLQMGHKEDATKYFEKCLELEPSHSAALEKLALI